MTGHLEIQFCEWLYVWSDSVEAARRFFGAPRDWPCEFVSIGLKGRLYRVKSEGLTVR